jgi:sugar/nucleoside kinase (ribokinase family)
LEEAGIDLRLRRLPGPTARLDLTYDETGEVAGLKFSPGVECSMDVSWLPSDFWTGDWVVVGTSPHDYQAQVIDRAHSSGRRVSLSTQSEFSQEWEKLAEILPNLDVLFINSREVVSLRGERLAQGLESIRAVNPHLACVLTCGERGAFLLLDQKLWKVPVYPGPVLNTTGAGDAFAAGWLASWTSGLDMPQALSRAAVAASLALRGPAHTTLPDNDRLQRELALCPRLSVTSWPAFSEEAMAVLDEEDSQCHYAVERQVNNR